MRLKTSLIKKVIPFLLLLLTLSLQSLFKNNPELTETLYSTKLYPIIAGVLSGVSSLLPFSLDDVFYASLVISLLLGIILILTRKVSVRKFLWIVIWVVALLYSMFYLFWGYNYYRQPAHDRLTLNRSMPNDSVFIRVFNKVIEETNRQYISDSALYKHALNTEIENSYEKLAGSLKIIYPSGKRPIKHISFSDFFAKATILGYYGPFFSETHINKHLTPWDMPVVLAHEKSHQFGVTSEAEAGFYGWLVSVKSKNRFVVYSGWLFALNHFIYQSFGLKEQSEMISRIRPEVISDLRARKKHWLKWRNQAIDNAASRINDAYLKSNNVKGGIEDYNGVVQLIIDYMLQE